MPNFDVFLSHNSQDKPAIEQIARKLRDEHGLKCWLDKWHLVPGEPWEEAIEDALDDCQTYAVFLGPSGIGSWENEEFRSALDTRVRDKKRRVIPVLLPGAPDSRDLKLPRFLQRLTWVDFRSGLDDDDALYRLVCGIQGIAPGDVSKDDKKSLAEDELPAPGILPASSRMYFGHNPNFTGRVDDLKALAKALVFDPQPGALTVTQTLAGMGGIGKTQLAVEFCYRYGRSFHGVHWMDARQTLDAEIAACGAKMNLPNWPQTTPEQVRLTLNAWQADPKRLLVLDNLEEPEVLRTWKPEFEGMSVLATSRNQTWDTDLALMHTINILSRAEGIALLRKLAPRLEKLPDEAVDLVAKKLGYLPLALDLAGRYLRDHPITPTEYLEKLSETALRHKSLKETKTGSPTQHDTDVEVTFLVSWEQLGDVEVDELAKRFFIAAGYLASNIPIPRDIFHWLSLPDDWRKRKIIEPDENKKEIADDAILRLQALGLLTETLALHPLLAEFARVQEIDHAILMMLMDKIAIISVKSNNSGIPANFVNLRPHVEMLNLIAESAEIQGVEKLLNNLGFHYYELAEFSKARQMLEKAVNNSEKFYGKNNHQVAENVRGLGTIFSSMGNLKRAKAMLKRALAIDEKTYGSEHPMIVADINNLGLTLKRMGDLPGAKAMYERALAISEKQLGPEHRNTASCLNNLGILLRDMGDLPSAKAMCERAMAIDEKIYDKEHPEVALHLHNISFLIAESGDLPQALDLEQRALAMWQKFLPPEHPNIQSARRNLAEIERRMNSGES